MLELLEFLLELVVNLCEVADRWRFGLCLMAGGALAFLIDYSVDHPKACVALVTVSLLTAVVSGIIWEVH